MDFAAAAPKKIYVPSLILVSIIGVIAGFSGIFIPLNIFFAALFGIILLAIALYKTEFALALLVMVVPLTNARVNIGPIPLDAVTICATIVIISYFLNEILMGQNDEEEFLITAAKSTDKKNAKAVKDLKNLKPMPFTWAFFAFLAISSISAVVAPSFVEAIAVLIRFAGYFLLVFVIGRTIKSRNTLTWILVLMVVAGSLTGLYGLYQYLYAPQTAKIGLYDLTEDVAGRVGSTFQNPNFYAEYLVLLVPIGLALVLGSKGIFRRFSMAVATLLLFTGLILTYTRGSWLSTGIGIAIMSVLTEAWLFWVWVFLFALALVIAPGVASRFASILDTSGGTAGFRRRLWTIALGIIGEHPLIGIGIGNYYDAFTEYIFRHPELSVGWVIYGAHNSYLTIWAETGIFGILSFLAIIIIAIRYGLYLSHVKASDKYLSWINSAIFAGVIGFSLNSLTSNSFHHPQGAVFFWIMLGLQVAIERLQPEKINYFDSDMVQNSVILKLLSNVGRAFKSAIKTHFLLSYFADKPSSFGKSLDKSWIGSFKRWLQSEPFRPQIVVYSSIYKPLKKFSFLTRKACANSFTFSTIYGVSKNPFLTSILFIVSAIVCRSMLFIVINR